jgi:hypothetical protein
MSTDIMFLEHVDYPVLDDDQLKLLEDAVEQHLEMGALRWAQDCCYSIALHWMHKAANMRIKEGLKSGKWASGDSDSKA